MRFGTDWLHIAEFMGNHVGALAFLGIISLISAICCMVITKARKQLTEDAVFAFFFGLVFNLMALLFVIFRKPVWNNLGWIPVVAAWFLIDANLLAAIMLVVYAVIWAVAQNRLLKRIEVVKD